MRVFRTRHGHHVGNDAGALEATRLRVHIAVLDFHLGAEFAQTLDVLIDGTRADGAPPRQTDASRAEARHERAERENGGTHRFHKFVRRHRFGKGPRVQRHVIARALHAHAHAFEQLEHRAHVGQVGHVVKDEVLGRQNRCGENRKSGRFGARGTDFTDETASARNSKFLHVNLSCRAPK